MIPEIRPYLKGTLGSSLFTHHISLKRVFFFIFLSLPAAGTKLWSNIMEILDEKDGVDTELLVYAMTLINKVGVTAGSICVGVTISSPVQHVIVTHLWHCFFSEPQACCLFAEMKFHSQQCVLTLGTLAFYC